MTPSLKITKTLVPVVIYTATHRIEGFYHAFDNGGRLLDDLNEQGRNFIPLTDARITKLQGEGEMLVSKFLAVSVLSITLFFPNPKLVSQKTTESRTRSGEAPPVARQPFVESTSVPGLLIRTAGP